jgi:hypothetical protein
VFEPPGRVEDAHHVKLIDKYCGLGAGVANRLTEDVADEAGVIKNSKRACTRCADRDAVIDACAQTSAGLVTDRHVTTTVNAVAERVITDGCVARTRCVVLHRKITERIIFTAVIGGERVPPMSVVECTTYI